MQISNTIIASVVSVIVLLIICKIIGARQIGQMSIFDYVTSITIGSIAAEMAIEPEEWAGPIVAMVVYGLMAFLISLATCKSMTLRKFFNGRPSVLYENKTIYKANLLKARLDINEFLTQCRMAGYFDLSQLEAAVLETNGHISFLPLETARPATPADFDLKPERETLLINLIIDGKLIEENLTYSGKDMTWLKKQLHSEGIGQISEVFLATCDGENNFHAYRIVDNPKKHDIFE